MRCGLPRALWCGRGRVLRALRGVAVALPSLPPSLSRIVPLSLVGAARPGPWALGGAASGRGPRRLLGNSGGIAEDGGGDAQLPQGAQDGCGETRGRQDPARGGWQPPVSPQSFMRAPSS